MTDLRGWQDYQYCWLDGTVLKVRGGRSFTVSIDAFRDGKEHSECVIVGRDRLQARRGASLDHEWTRGERVQVRELNGKPAVEGWWEATVRSVDTELQQCTILWEGEHEKHGRSGVVKFTDMRTADAPLAMPDRSTSQPPPRKKSKRKKTV